MEKEHATEISSWGHLLYVADWDNGPIEIGMWS